MTKRSRKSKAGFWTVPKIWDDSDCFILGGGPSLKSFDPETLRGRHVLAVNCASDLAGWFDAMFFGDKDWYHRFGQYLNRFGGLKITRHDSHIGRPGVLVVHHTNDWGISTDPNNVCWNMSSGGCAINLAVLLGAKRVILLGFDMKKVDGRYNYHDRYPQPSTKKYDPYKDKFLAPFPAISKQAKSIGVEILNATPGSAIPADLIRQIDLSEVIS